MNNSTLIDLVATLAQEVQQLRREIQYGTQLYPQKATIFAVNDPESLGRVKVVYDTHPEDISDWIYVLGYGAGRVPEQYIGTGGVTVFLDGHQENGVFLGTINSDKLNSSIKGSPSAVPIIDSRANTAYPPCDADSEGQILLFKSTTSVDLKLCLRRNHIDTKDGAVLPEIYSWKSLTSSFITDKGEYGKSNDANENLFDTTTEKDWGACSESLEGEKRLFSQDRSLPQNEFICRKGVGGKYSWFSASSLPIYGSVNLPTCSRDNLGATAMVDDGVNSELIVCSRYQDPETFRWVKFKREPILFTPGEPPITKEEIIENEDSVVGENSYTATVLDNISFSSVDGVTSVISDILSLWI